MNPPAVPITASGSECCATASRAAATAITAISPSANPTGSNAYSRVAANTVRYSPATPPPCSRCA